MTTYFCGVCGREATDAGRSMDKDAAIAALVEALRRIEEDGCDNPGESTCLDLESPAPCPSCYASAFLSDFSDLSAAAAAHDARIIREAFEADQEATEKEIRESVQERVNDIRREAIEAERERLRGTVRTWPLSAQTRRVLALLTPSEEAEG